MTPKLQTALFKMKRSTKGYSKGSISNLKIILNSIHYDVLVVNKKQETTTTNFDDPQVVEDEISENCNIIDTEW